ncbi:unnamed protein product [Boreogadus saida]
MLQPQLLQYTLPSSMWHHCPVSPPAVVRVGTGCFCARPEVELKYAPYVPATGVDKTDNLPIGIIENLHMPRFIMFFTSFDAVILLLEKAVKWSREIAMSPRPAMRDRLSFLQELSDGQPEAVEQMEYAESSAASDSYSNVDLEDLQSVAVVFDTSQDLDEVLGKAQEIHREVQLIRLETKRLREQNARVLQGTTRMSTIKRDANAIGTDIKLRAEGVLQKLRDMDHEGRKMEEEHGANAAVSRIARTQYACLSNGFRDTMFDYNEAEMNHRENCKAHIQRQMEIVGRETTGEEVEEMIETGQWNIFGGELLAEGKTARSALTQIEKRHQDLVELETRIKNIHEIFLDIALLVEEQGPMLTSIQSNIQKTDGHIQEALMKLGRAKRHDKNNPFKKMFCSCFPCYK